MSRIPLVCLGFVSALMSAQSWGQWPNQPPRYTVCRWHVSADVYGTHPNCQLKVNPRLRPEGHPVKFLDFVPFTGYVARGCKQPVGQVLIDLGGYSEWVDTAQVICPVQSR
jgi:hypothetical protein